MCKEEINYIEVRLENSCWSVYENGCEVRGMQYSAKDRCYAIVEARSIAKRLAPSEFRVVENGIETKIEKLV